MCVFTAIGAAACMTRSGDSVIRGEFPLLSINFLPAREASQPPFNQCMQV